MSSLTWSRSPAALAWWIASSGKPCLPVPGARPPVQDRDQLGLGRGQFVPQHVREQMVVAVPLPLLVERQEEQVGPLQLAEEAGRALAIDDGIAQVGRQPFKERRAEQEPSERWWLRVQQLGP